MVGLLVIGASQWKYASLYAKEFPGVDLRVISRSGMTVDEVDESMIKATESYNRVVLHLGTNNLIVGHSPQKTVAYYERLVTNILRRNPRVHLYISSVLFRSRNRYREYTPLEGRRLEVLNAATMELNSLLKNLSVRYGAFFIDNWRRFQQASSRPGEELLSKDGLHLSPKGIRCLMGNVICFCRSFRLQKRVNFSSGVSLIPKVPSRERVWSSACLPLPVTRKPVSLESPRRAKSSAFTPQTVASAVTRKPTYAQVCASSSTLLMQYKQVFSSGGLSSKNCVVPEAELPSPSMSSLPRNYMSSSPAVSSKLSLTSMLSFPNIEIPIKSPINFKLTTPSNAPQISWVSSHLPFKELSKKLKVTSPSILSQQPSGLRVGKFRDHTSFSTSQIFPCISVPTSNPWTLLSSLKPSSSDRVQVPNRPGHSSECESVKIRHHSSSIQRPDLKSVTLFNQPFPNSSISVPSTAPHYDNCNKFPCRRNGGSTEILSKCSYPRLCPDCNKIYSSKSSFYRHKSICGKTNDKILYPRVCSSCHVSYSSKASFSRHIKCCTAKSSYITCPKSDCEVKFQSHSVLMDHLQIEHQENIALEEYNFKDLTEFQTWKKQHCDKNHISMVKHSGSFTRGEMKSSYYICKFNNHHKDTVSANKTSRKRKFGKMPNSDCLARMIVKESDSSIFVKYYNSHNHELKFKNVKFFRWDKTTKKQINSFLEQDVPSHTIQEHFQPVDTTAKDLSPIKEHFITSTQICKMKYELEQNKRLSKDDAEAIHLLVHSMTGDIKKSVLIYKPQGKPTEVGNCKLDSLPHSADLFALGIQLETQLNEMLLGCTRILCIDSTHGTNQYKFHLLNFIVPDEYGVGYPVAHFITNYLDEDTLVIFLQSIRDRSPDLQVNAFMTDGDEALGNALKTVFGDSITHLLCTWHVKRNWQKNLHRKVKDIELLSEINETLEAITEEKNEHNFNIMLESFLLKYSQTSSEFISYFKNNYLPKKEKWAMCYRNFPHATTETNMYAESFHNKLKTNYLKRKVNRRLDDLVHTLFKISKTTHLALIYKRMTEEPPLGFLDRKASRHARAMHIPDADIIQIDLLTWKVKSQSDPKLSFHVTSVSEVCHLPDLCFVKCNENSCFSLCSHMYKCTCPDKHVICKHIHKLHSFIVRNNPVPLSSGDDNDRYTLSNLSQSNLKNEPAAKVTPKSCNEHVLKSIGGLTSKLTHLISHPATEPLLHHINNTLKLLVDRSEELIEKQDHMEKPPSLLHEPLPPNSKMPSQQGLFQTVKTRKPAIHRFRRPSPNRRSAIRTSLLQLKNDITDSSYCFTGFTEPIISKTTILKPLFQVGQFSINELHLKSLDTYVNPEERDMLLSVAPDFHPGWLYDSVIAAFFHKISVLGTEVSFLDPAVSQFVLGNIALDRLSIMFTSLVLNGFSKIVIPINPNSNHWMLLVVCPEEKIISFYDPASSVIKGCYMDPINKWIRFLSLKMGMKTDEWRLNAPKHCLQEDSHNCGVFISWYGERILLDESTEQTFSTDEYRHYMFTVITGKQNIK